MGLFSSKKQPNAKKKVNVQQRFEAQMPDAAFENAKNEFYAANGRPIVERSRYFLISVFLSILCIVLGLVLYQITPLKTVEPYVIAVDKEHGIVVKSQEMPVQARAYNPERPVIERELFRWLENLYALNADYPRIVQQGHIAAYRYTRARAAEEFKAFIDSEQPYQRQAKTPGLLRSIERGTVNFREDGKLVLMRYRTLEKDVNRPVPITRNWVMTLQFERVQPTDKAELDVNPLGIYVTHFEISEDR